jgi:methylated-DNA-[protein]-cysteine S-methyltransferase
MSYATAEFTTPVGKMLAAIDEQGALVRLDFLVGRTAEAIRREIGAGGGSETPDPEACRPVVEQLQAYFRGDRRDFDLQLDPTGSDFQQQVWRELLRIPYGETITYGELARRVGRPKASRAVGQASGSNRIAVVIPCHRVVGANGSLTGYASGMEIKEKLLTLEGALQPSLALD